MTEKERVIKALEENDMPLLLALAQGKKRRIFRILISLTYDKDSLICWRSIEAIGAIAGSISETDPETVRHLAQRLLWMMRDESGNNPWSAPEMLGEIVRNCPGQLADIAPVIASFHDEEILRRGVLRAIVRIGEKRPDLVNATALPLAEYLRAADATVRAYAVMIVCVFSLSEFAFAIKNLLGDESGVKIYSDHDLRIFEIGKLAAETVNILSGK